MNKMGTFAAALVISSSAVAIGGFGTPALADPRPNIDIIDDVVPNASVLSNLLPNLNASPAVVCLPTASNVNSVKGHNNQTNNNQTINCTQSAQTNAPPSGGDFSGYEVLPLATDTCGPNDVCDLRVDCPAGKKVIEGGYNIHPGAGTFTSRSMQTPDGSAYIVQAFNRSGAQLTIEAQVSCARVTP
ncbi:hypothetical protein ACIBQ1_10845 [Nonomuraea sp. NPDC050153]|uniref:hypothetical protein n=1 Tax=Nonomuraea sp. NPDC050153 TaxID=3364359 RepID=UPI0037B33568